MSQPDSRKSEHLTPSAPLLRGAEAFIDEIESKVARILLQGEDGEWRGYHLPVGLLPEGAREGDWLKITLTVIPPPEGADPAALRKRLGQDDPGGNIHL